MRTELATLRPRMWEIRHVGMHSHQQCHIGGLVRVIEHSTVGMLTRVCATTRLTELDPGSEKPRPPEKAVELARAFSAREVEKLFHV